jgi:acetyl esterase/lipase
MTNAACRNRIALGLLAASLAAAPARADRPAAPPCAVKEVRNVAYYEGEGANPVYHRLDLYLPEGKKDFPVLVLVHGGAWMLGDRSFFGWGEDLGRHFAGRGIGVVMPSYRLSPAVKHPEHVKDVARVVAWTVRHIGCYGGDPAELFLCGHSAGGHLVSLLATDPSYLKAEGLSPAALRGVISVSGVYRIPAIDLDFKLPNLSAGALRPLTNLFGASDAGPAPPKMPTGGTGRLGGLPLNLFGIVFGSDPRACAAASPMTYVRPGLPPFLLITAERDLPFLPGMARDFAAALRAARGDVRLRQVKGRGHEDVMFRATTTDDPVARAIESFVRARLGGSRPAPAEDR